MRLDDHIAKRFLTDDTLAMEIIEYMYPDAATVFGNTDNTEKRKMNELGYEIEVTAEQLTNKIATLYQLLITPKGHKPYYCTKSVLDCLDMLKISKKGDHFDWTFFKGLPDQIATFIFPDNKMLRMQIIGETIAFIHVQFTEMKENRNKGNMDWIMFHLNRKTGELCEHFGHKDVINIEKFIYSLLCFVYLADNEEIVIPAHSKYGTRKSGKIINSSPYALVMINSKWNVTSIRNEGFTVSPHFAVRWTGTGRTIPKIVFIDQFEKSGYIRKGGGVKQ